MAEEKSSKSRYVFLLVRIAVIAGGITWAVIWLRSGQRWDNLKVIFHQLNIWVFAGCLVIFTLGHLMVSSRWWLLLRAQSIFIGFWVAVRLYFLGWFYNNFMPSSVGGDLVRAWYVTKHTDKRLEAALSVFVDRAIGLTSTLVIALFFYSVFLRGKGSFLPAEQGETGGGFIEGIWAYKGVFVLVFVIALVVFCLLLVNRTSRAALLKLWLSVRSRGLKIISKTTNAIIIYCRNPLTILAVFGLTVFMQLMVITGFWFLGVNLGIEASIKYYYTFFTLVWVLGALPISIGGAVVMEGLLAYLFVKFAGVEAEPALALALCQRAVWMLTSLPGAVIHLVGAHLPVEGDNSGECGKEFSIDEDKAKD